MTDPRTLLQIPASRLDAVNKVLLDPNSRVMNDFLAVVAKYGTAEEINRKHRESRKTGKPPQDRLKPERRITSRI